MQKIIHTLILLLFFSLPLVHGQLLKTLGIYFGIGISGNYEFFKSQFFILISGIIFILFGIQTFIQKRDIVFPKILFPIVGILGISSIFSLSAYTSFFGLSNKGHGALMFLSLVGIYLVLIQQKKDLMKYIFCASILGAIFASIIAIKEYYSPTFDYGDLQNRALGTFGQPNYLAAYLLLLIPFLTKKAKIYRILLLPLIIIVIALFFTKSAWGISLFIGYMIYMSYIYFCKNYTEERIASFPTKYIFISLSMIFTIIGTYILIDFGLFTKLHSFLSRFYIWESVLRIIINNPKILWVGSGLETLLAYFENYKSPELYIFENFGFTADRPHNALLNIIFHFGVGGALIFGYLLYTLFQKYKNNYIYHSLILVLLFTFFNFLSVASYLIIVALCSCITLQNTHKYTSIFSLFFIIFGCISSFFCYKYLLSESYAYKGNYTKALEIFPYNYKAYEYISDSENILKYAGYPTKNFYITQLGTQNTQFICDKFIAKHGSAESAFYCGNYAWTLGQQELAKKYYNTGLEKIPNLWDQDSPYHSNFLISHFVDGKRFYSPKYSNLEEILERMEIRNKFKQ